MRSLFNRLKQLFVGFPLASIVVIISCVAALLILEGHSATPNNREVIKDIVIAVLASDIFIIAVNLQRPLVINDYLVIRRRESQTGNPVSISLLVGCPYSKWLGNIYDVNCIFIYHIDDGAGSNSAFTQTANRELIAHHYRFSFIIEADNEFLKRFWEDYLNTPNNKNTITVSITGTSNRLGGRFRYQKEYSISSIIISEDSFGMLEKKQKNSSDIKKGILKDYFNDLKLDRDKRYWEVFRMCAKLNESDSSIISTEIMSLIKP